MALFFLIGALIAFQGFNHATAHYDRTLLEATWGLVDEGEIEPFALLLKKEILAESGSMYALAATITAVGELAWPRPASGCGHKKIINANVALAEGNLGWDELKDAIDSYAVVLAQAVENLRILGTWCILPAPWPTLENSCKDFGRIYEFEHSWDLATPEANEGVRDAARRLYLAFGARANNVGAAATSAATAPALDIFNYIEHDLINYLEVVVNQDSTPAYCEAKTKKMRTLAGQLKAAIFKAATKTKDSYRDRCH